MIYNVSAKNYRGVRIVRILRTIVFGPPSHSLIVVDVYVTLIKEQEYKVVI